MEESNVGDAGIEDSLHVDERIEVERWVACGEPDVSRSGSKTCSYTVGQIP